MLISAALCGISSESSLFDKARVQYLFTGIQKKRVKDIQYEYIFNPYADPERGGGAGSPDPPPLKSHKDIGFLSSTGLDPLKNHRATKPAINDWPSSTRQQNAI